MSDYLDINNEELLKDFFTEAEQQVETLESNVLVIENDPTNHEAIDEIFRAAHTLKGGSATVEMSEITTFTHAVEDVLDEVRSDKISVNEDIVDVLLKSIDVIVAMLKERSNGSIYQEDVTPILNRLHALIPEGGEKKKKSSPPPQSAPKPVAPPPPPVAAAAPSSASSSSLSADEYRELKESLQGSQKLYCVDVRFDESNPMNSVGGIQVFAALKACGTVLKTHPDFDALYEDEFYPQVLYYLASSQEPSAIEDVAFLSDVTLSTDCQLVNAPSEGSVSAPKPAAAPQPAPVAQAAPQAASQETAAPAPAAQAPAASAEKAEKPAPAKENAPAKAASGTHIQQGTVLRVDSKRIDYLLNLVSETVITKATFSQYAFQLNDIQLRLQTITNASKDKFRKLLDELSVCFEQVKNGASIQEVSDRVRQDYSEMLTIFDPFGQEIKDLNVKFRSSTQSLSQVVSDMQEGVMKIRMVPIGQIFNRFPRVVRDLQRDLKKKVNLVIEGEDTELDKTVVDDLLDPVMHCVRNSVDHGIEAPDVRAAAGKDETGTLLLKASNEGNQIVIQIVDDGAGINVEKVRNKAISKGLLHPDKILTDQEAYNLIFAPGFSTADKISNVSGRGVGLDVVKTMIEKLKGTVSVSSGLGKGTTFTIKLPLTLAIIQGLLVRVGRQIYSIPITSVIESQRVLQEEIKTIDNYEVMNVRNEVISVLRLSRLFHIKSTNNDKYCFVVIVGTQEKKIGVMVDSLIGEEDVVIKPLNDQFTNSPGIAGASILGDGSVSLIIDVSQLLELGVQQELSAQQINTKRA
ncbi:MAG: chemotaxis protein CheW [Treponemataceae bacterium]|nr:chemotaxis protein CheW [Treponemataceae bacterium]